MNKVFFFLLFVLCTGCAVQRTSRFTSDRIKPGMTKEEVIALYGKPYKESTFTDNNNVLHEDYYYKEQLFVKRWYEVNNILHFENAILRSLEQGEEKLLYKNSQVIVK
jgi:hypothetical protein